MKKIITFSMGVILAFTQSLLFAGITKQGENYVVSGSNYTIVFDSTNGAIKKIISSGKDTTIATPEGLWKIGFFDKESITSAQASCKANVANQTLMFSYKHQDVDIDVAITPKSSYCDFQATLNLKSGEMREIEFPTTLRFAPEAVKSVSVHVKNPRTIGLELNSSFYQKNKYPMFVYDHKNVLGDKIYKRVFDEPLKWVDFNSVNLQLGKDADAWLSKAVQKTLLGVKFNACRLFNGSVDVELAKSKDGVVVGAKKIGNGLIFRVGTLSCDKRVMQDLMRSISDKSLKASKPEANKKVGFIKISEPNVDARDNCAYLNRIFKDKLVVLSTPEMLDAALRGNEYALIINPYAELCPNIRGETPEAFADDLKNYLSKGGNWFECGGYTFFKQAVNKEYLSLGGHVPAVIADFAHMNFNGAKIAYYSVQDIHGSSFENPFNSFTTSRFSTGGDVYGGYYSRAFTRYIKAGKDSSWKSPIMRMNFGKSMQASVDAFCKDNGITKKYSEKVDPVLAKRFAEAVMITMWDNTLEKMKKAAELVPPNNLLHPASYLLGGFDKQYPDHFPPRPSFSTPEEYKAFIAESRKAGHLFMPYVNYSWWCDKPRGPSFEKAGEAPLSIKRDGKLSHERYASNEGYTVCLWHPDARKANQKLRKELIQEYPCDVIFQDQMGARDSILDFNKASPNPNRYSDGFIYSLREDAKAKPLSTEDGWWGIANEELQFCGMSFGLDKYEYNVGWATYVWENFPPEAVNITNLVGAMFHDKVSLSHHDLVWGVRTDRQMSLALGIGYTLAINYSYEWTKHSNYWQELVKWLDKMQKAVVSKYIGKKMRSFKHVWANPKIPDGSSYIRAQYGNVKVFSNLTEKPFDFKPPYAKDMLVKVSPMGFFVEVKGTFAGNVLEINGLKADNPCCFIVQYENGNAKVCTYGIEDSTQIFPCKKQIKSLKMADGKQLAFVQKNGVVQFKMPKIKGTKERFVVDLIVE